MNIERFSKDLIRRGSRLGWQDLYVLPGASGYDIFWRIGKRRELVQHLEVQEAQQLISRFKYLGQMNVSERRKAQLGAITLASANGRQRLRLSTVGDYLQRESLVVRFLFQFGKQPARYALAFQSEKIYQHLAQRGLYLFSGPVGSGKTTLMYLLAKRFDGQVITIEDPVEIEEISFLQLQTNNKIEQDYDALVKLSLRHHPDVLIIGEIRDETTARAAVRAALTGHFVFATIHARNLDSVKSRLSELSGDETEVDECLQGIIYQEMVSIQAQPQVLCAYRFFEGKRVTEEFLWQQGLAALKGQLDEA